jgi:hypothetical protein
MRKSGHVPCI